VQIKKIALLFALLASARVFAQSGEEPFVPEAGPDAAAHSAVISSIEIIGLKRTRPHIARYPLERFLGVAASELDGNAVKAAVIDTGILEPLEVEVIPVDGENAVLRVTVNEKWSIIPFPIFSAQSGGYSGGLFLADANAFGRRDQAAVGGFYGSGGWSLAAFYNATPDRKVPGWTTAFSYRQDERKDLNSKGETLRRFKNEKLDTRAGIYYSFSEYLIASLDFSYGQVRLLKDADPLARPEDGARYLELAPRLGLRTSKWDGYLLSVKSASLSYKWHWGLQGDSFHQVEFDGVFQHSLVPGFRFNLRGAVLYSPRAPVLFESGPQVSGTGLLPAMYSAQSYGGISAGFEKYLFKFKYGTISALAGWQTVLADGPLSGRESGYGPAGGLSLYLSRLALPGLSFALGYNIKTRLPQFSFNMGMSL
jgi:outer membrane protein assembly factor BamA